MKTKDQTGCPVCGKVGIGDYRHEDVVCSCCGADLSIYKMLYDIKKAPQSATSSAKTWKITTVILAIIVIINTFCWMFIDKSTSSTNSENIKELSILKDSINTLMNDLNKAKEELSKREIKSKEKESEYLIYIVKKKDSPCLISKKLYGTERRYKEIEDILTKPLEPGDTLKLKK